MTTNKVSDEHHEPVDYANPTPSQYVRDLLARANLSQRQGAHELEVDERTVRYWCSGKREVPKVAILALERLANMSQELRDDPFISRWRREALRNERQIEFLESPNAGIGYGPAAGTNHNAKAQARLLRMKNDTYERLIKNRAKKLEGESYLTQAEEERDVIDRLDDAFEQRSLALRDLRDQFLPYGDGILDQQSMDKFDARDREWREAQAEADRIVQEIRSGKRG